MQAINNKSTNAKSTATALRRPTTVDKYDRRNPMAKYAKEFDVPQYGTAKYQKGKAYKLG